MDNAPDPELQEPANLRFLRVLVTTLTGVMIGGLVLIITLVALDYTDRAAPLPEAITLPDGTTAHAFTYGQRFFAVVTTDDRILIYDRDTQELRREITINIAPDP
ncbi:MAG: DUF6476 family protein [Paracoccaceae bacterium]